MSNPYSPDQYPGTQPTGSDPYAQTDPWGQQPQAAPSAPQQEAPASQAPQTDPYAQATQGAYGQPQQAAPYGQPVQGGYGQPVYGQPAAAFAPGVDVNKLQSNSTIVLVLGILGLILIGLLGSIPAWIWGGNLMKEARAAGLPEDVVSNAKIGRILGIVGTILHGLIALMLIGSVIFMMVVIGSMDPDPYGMLTGII